VLQAGALNVKVASATQTTQVAIRRGEAVGWSALAGRDTYTASVECVEPSRVWKINKDKLDQILRRHSTFGLLFYKRFAGLVGERLIRCYQELVKLKEE
jgi:CRP-like cAMP-binding protein